MEALNTAQFPRNPSSKKTHRFYKQRFKKLRRELAQWQRILYAEDRRALLLIFQAMNVAGKDSTIRHVLT